MIDPYLQRPGCPPPQYVTPNTSINGHTSAAENGARDKRNLKIVARNGDVMADVWVLGGGDGRPIGVVRTSIEIVVDNGSIALRIVRTSIYLLRNNFR